MRDSICRRFVRTLIKLTKLRVNILKRQVLHYILMLLFEKSESINYVSRNSNLFISYNKCVKLNLIEYEKIEEIAIFIEHFFHCTWARENAVTRNLRSD